MYALASVLQQRGAAAQPEEQTLKLSLLGRLLRNPGWVLGLVCDIAGFAFQALALSHGTLVLVQPLLVCGILFALPMGAAWAGRKLGPADWVAAVLTCAGLATFLSVASPADGHDNVRPFIWILLLASSAGSVAVLIILSRGRAPWKRAVLLSGAAGIVYGSTAALTKTTTHLLHRGVPHLLVDWQPWVLLLSGVAGMVIAQSAFQAGSLDASLPTMSVVDPIVSIVIGAVAFGERISASPGSLAAEVISLATLSVGVFVLARSESNRVTVDTGPEPPDPPGGPHVGRPMAGHPPSSLA
jgi:drug/metabolite transporter (DMT)-like permease